MEKLTSKNTDTFIPPQKWKSIFRIFTVVWVVSIFSSIIFAHERIVPALLMFAGYIGGLGLGALAFIAILYVTRSGWSAVIRRVPEAMVSIALLVIPVIIALVAYRALTNKHLLEIIGSRETYWFKVFWMQPWFVIIRTLIYCAIWALFARAILRTSRRQDIDGDVAHTYRNMRLSTGFLFAFAFTFTLASIDWVMSLEPTWSSSIYALYHFSGMFLSALAVMTVIVIWLMKTGPFKGLVTKSHLYDLGSLVFTFACFWAYIWFSQYMLNWYTNKPDETSYYVHRTSGPWLPLFLLNFVLNFGIPFLALMPRNAKTNPNWLMKVCIVILIGRWLDLYILIQPSFTDGVPAFGIPEVGLIFGIVGVFGSRLLTTLSKFPLVPSKDPYIEESLTH